MPSARQLGTQAELKRYDIGHFGSYVGDSFERASSDQLAFFHRMLGWAVVRAAYSST